MLLFDYMLNSARFFILVVLMITPAHAGHGLTVR